MLLGMIEGAFKGGVIRNRFSILLISFNRAITKAQSEGGIWRLCESRRFKSRLGDGRTIATRHEVADTGSLPVPLFCAGGIATPADAALVMQLGAEGVFVGSGIFKSEDPEARARAIVEATTHYRDPARIAAASEGLGTAMTSIETAKLADEQLLAQRGW